MSRRLGRGGGTRLLFLLAGIGAGVLLAAAEGLARNGLPTAPSDPGVRILGRTEFDRPTWMAVLADGEAPPILVGTGEAVFPRGGHAALGVVRAVSPVQLLLEVPGTREPVRVFPGRSLPGSPSLGLRDVVQVRGLEYRQRTLVRGEPKRGGGEYYYVALRDGRAILQRDTDPPPSSLELFAERLAAVRVAEVEPGTWEVSASQLFETVRSGEPVIWEALRGSGVELSAGGGVAVELKTPVVDAKVDRRGFVVASPKLAERAGLRLQDRIVSVNDAPIDGFGALVQAYQQIRTSPDLTTVRVVVERDGAPLTLTYRLR